MNSVRASTIDLKGLHLRKTRRFRTVAGNGRIALVIDDVPSRNVQPRPS